MNEIDSTAALEDLIQGARQNDDQKTYALTKLMYHLAQKYTSAMLGNSSSGMQDDIIQDSVLKALRSLDQLTNTEGFSAWMNRIVRNTALDYLRSSPVTRTTVFSDFETKYDYTPYDPSDEKISERPDLAMDEKTRQNIIMEVLNTLPEEQRVVIMMKFYDDMTIQEIANELDLPASTVTGRLQKGKDKIKKSVSEIQERDDIRLYGMAPLPFFLYLFKKWNGLSGVPVNIGASGDAATASNVSDSSNANSVSDEPSLKKPASGTSGYENVKSTVNGAASGTNLANAASAAGKIAGASAGTKIIAGVAVAVTVIGGGYVVSQIGGGSRDPFVGKYTFKNTSETMTIKSDGTCVDVDVNGVKTACTWEKIEEGKYQVSFYTILDEVPIPVEKVGKNQYSIGGRGINAIMEKK